MSKQQQVEEVSLIKYQYIIKPTKLIYEIA